MILSAHQPAYLPWLGFFHKIAISDFFVILDAVQFEKNSFINRNRIKTADGVQWLTVPVLKTGYTNKTIMDMKINNVENWQKKHWNKVYLNYKKTRYFNKYADYFQNIYSKQWMNLTDLLIESMNFLINELNIKTKIILQSTLGTKEKKEQLIMEICEIFKADSFVFGALGRNYASEENFNSKEINIYFQNYKHPTYLQQWGEFEPCLSIVDLLFNVGADNTLNIIMENNIQKEDLKKLLQTG